MLGTACWLDGAFGVFWRHLGDPGNFQESWEIHWGTQQLRLHTPVRGTVHILGATTTNQIAAILQGLQGLQGYKATRTIRTIRTTRLQGYKAIRLQDYRM